MTVSPPLNQDQVERRVASLAASEFSAAQLHRACLATLDAQLPLRDAIVLREAKRLADLETPESREAWGQVREAIHRSVPESTYRLWIEPLEAAGAEGETLFLTAPETIRAWSERRYSALISEALRDCSPFTTVSFVAPALAAGGGEG